MNADEIFVGDGDLDAARALVSSVDAELFLYPGTAHLFADNSLSSYDVAAASVLIQTRDPLPSASLTSVAR